MEKQADIRQMLAERIAGLPAEQIKQAVLQWLNQSKEASLVLLEQTLTAKASSSAQPEDLSPNEKALAFRAWAENHQRGLPLLSDDDISRDSIYSDERL